MTSKCILTGAMCSSLPSSSDDEEYGESSDEEREKEIRIKKLEEENQNLRQTNSAQEALAKETLANTVQQLTAQHLDETATLKRKHDQLSQKHLERISELEDENDSLREENRTLASKWNDAFTRHAELLRTEEKLRQANKDWEDERRDKLQAIDELEVAKNKAWAWEMLFRHQGEMPIE